MEKTFIAENNAERQRLFEMTAKLTEKDLARQLPNGWSVADALVHLAFWDTYGLFLLREWQKNGFKATSSDIPAVNEGVRVLSSAIPANAVVSLVRQAAEAVDSEVEKIAPKLIAAIEAGGKSCYLHRAEHRSAHLNRIESELGL
jgi:7-keto-8-aminopelargonate synthetase-like enzyme